jgi:hypothetical protein
MPAEQRTFAINLKIDASQCAPFRRPGIVSAMPDGFACIWTAVIWPMTKIAADARQTVIGIHANCDEMNESHA